VNKQNKIITWVVFYLCVTVASSAGFVFPLGDDNLWYNSLIEPSFTPPSWYLLPFGLYFTCLLQQVHIA